MKKRIKEIIDRIKAIKKELNKIGDMRPGTMSLQYQKPKEKKTPYHQVSYTHKMKSRTDYVRTSSVEDVEIGRASCRERV